MKKWIRTAALVFSCLFMFQTQAQAASLKDFETAEEVFQYIQDFYIQELNEETLEEQVIYGLIQSLNDPYTNYISPEKKEYMAEDGYIQIGIDYVIDQEGVQIIHVYEGTSADEAGLMVGDKVTFINGESKSDLDYYDMDEALTGEKDTELTLTIDRDGKQLEVSVKRQFIEQYLIESKMVDDHVGYVLLWEFHEKSGELFARHLEQLKQQGMDSLILDLRYNSGGYIDVLDQIAKQFWEKAILMHTMDRNGVKTPHVITGGTELDIPIVVLVNESSASASEILAGALQDYDRATIIGTYTYGKARMQDVLPLSNGGLLSLTSEAYLTPDMHDIQDIGIEPDIYVDEYYSQMFTAFQELGVNSITLVDHDYYTLVNGIKSYYYVPGLESYKDRYYVSSELLNHFVPIEVQSNDDFAEVVVHLAGKDITLKQSHGEFIVVDSEIYISVPFIHAWIPNFNVTNQDGYAVLTYNTK
ncbi:S41 family peptidase [Marinicrinis lubricantis]|uniref:S41 family peptidase n=1 Tax=Marinicrinis lubricantis TaxID=2086470 RepID=A0ABW1INW1_9BACL